MDINSTDLLVRLRYHDLKGFAYLVENEINNLLFCVKKWVETCDLSADLVSSAVHAIILPPIRFRFRLLLAQIVEWKHCKLEYQGWREYYGDQRCAVIFCTPEAFKRQNPELSVQLSDFFIANDNSSLEDLDNEHCARKSAVKGAFDSELIPSCCSRCTNFKQNLSSSVDLRLKVPPETTKETRLHTTPCLQTANLSNSSEELEAKKETPKTVYDPLDIDVIEKCPCGYSKEIHEALSEVAQNLYGVFLFPLKNCYAKYVIKLAKSSNRFDFQSGTFAKTMIRKQTIVKGTPRNSENYKSSNFDFSKEWIVLRNDPMSCPSKALDEALFEQMAPLAETVGKTHSSKQYGTDEDNMTYGGFEFTVEGTGEFGVLITSSECSNARQLQSKAFRDGIGFMIVWSSARFSSLNHQETTCTIDFDQTWFVHVFDHQNLLLASSSVQSPHGNGSGKKTIFWVTMGHQTVEKKAYTSTLIDGFFIEAKISIGIGEYPRQQILTTQFRYPVVSKAKRKWIEGDSLHLTQNKWYFGFVWELALHLLLSGQLSSHLHHRTIKANDFGIKNVARLGRLCDRHSIPRRDHLVQLDIRQTQHEFINKSASELIPGVFFHRFAKSFMHIAFDKMPTGINYQNINCAIPQDCRCQLINFLSMLTSRALQFTEDKNQSCIIKQQQIEMPKFESIEDSFTLAIRRIIPLGDQSLTPKLEFDVRPNASHTSLADEKSLLIVTSSPFAVIWLATVTKLSLLCFILKYKLQKSSADWKTETMLDVTQAEKNTQFLQKPTDNQNSEPDDCEFSFKLATLIDISDIQIDNVCLSLPSVLQLLNDLIAPNARHLLLRASILSWDVAPSQKNGAPTTSREHQQLLNDLQSIMPNGKITLMQNSRYDKEKNLQGKVQDDQLFFYAEPKDYVTSLFCTPVPTPIRPFGLIPDPNASFEEKECWLKDISHFSLEALQCLGLIDSLKETKRIIDRHKGGKISSSTNAKTATLCQNANGLAAKRLILRALQLGERRRK